MQSRPIASVQTLRFVAASSILLSHAADLFLPSTSGVWGVPWTAGVDVFFVISGFIMARLTSGQFGVRGSARTFLFRRAIRILPPYWFFTAVMIATLLLAPEHVEHSRLSGPHAAASFGFIPWPRADGRLNPLLSQGWTLNYEAFFYAALALALPFRRGLLGVVGGFCALAVAGPWIPANLFVARFYADPIILEFLGGMVIAALHGRQVRLARLSSLALCGAAVLAYFGFKSVHADWAGSRPLIFGVPALLLCAGLMLGRERNGESGLIERLLVAGGDASYSLYLSHTFTINAVALVWRRMAPDAAWIGVGVASGASIFIAVIFNRFIEQPTVRLLQRHAGVMPDRLRDVPPTPSQACTAAGAGSRARSRSPG